MTVQEYSTGQLAAQPIGYWSGATMRQSSGSSAPNWPPNSSPSRTGGLSTTWPAPPAPGAAPG